MGRASHAGLEPANGDKEYARQDRAEKLPQALA